MDVDFDAIVSWVIGIITSITVSLVFIFTDIIKSSFISFIIILIFLVSLIILQKKIKKIEKYFINLFDSISSSFIGLFILYIYIINKNKVSNFLLLSIFIITSLVLRIIFTRGLKRFVNEK